MSNDMSNDTRECNGRTPRFVPIEEVRRGDWFELLDICDRPTMARAVIIEPPVNNEQRWMVWIAPVFRGHELQSRLGFDNCESVEVWR